MFVFKMTFARVISLKWKKKCSINVHRTFTSLATAPFTNNLFFANYGQTICNGLKKRCIIYLCFLKFIVVLLEIIIIQL